jgi:hypothetical protein
MSGFSGSCETLRCRCLLFSVLIVALLAASSGYAQTPSAGGHIVIPGSSIEKPGDTGVLAHTNTRIFIPNRGAEGGQIAPRSAGSGVSQPPSTERTEGSARPQ